MAAGALLRRRGWKGSRGGLITPVSIFSGFSTGTEGDDVVSEKTTACASPPPIHVSITEEAGRGVFASRPIGAGDVIHTASPVVAHPSPSLLSKVCFYCLRRSCGGSRDLRYFCSDECRMKSEGFLEWEKKICWSAFDSHCIDQGLKYPFLVKRLACMVITGRVSPDILDILQPSILHQDMISKMEEEFELLKQAFLKAHMEDSVISFLTKHWYLGVLARIRINAFRVETVGASYEDLLDLASSSVMADSGVGNAVYMLPSFYNHDCDPNTHIMWINNADAKVKALRDIKTGEDLRICYIDASMDREARQSILYHGFGFQCHCPRSFRATGANF
ncbi:SET domain protein 38 isoform X2 [Wolffia australiana]